MNSRTLAGVAFSRWRPNCLRTTSRNRSNFGSLFSNFPRSSILPFSLPVHFYLSISTGAKELPSQGHSGNRSPGRIEILARREAGAARPGMPQYLLSLVAMAQLLAYPLHCLRQRGFALVEQVERIESDL